MDRIVRMDIKLILSYNMYTINKECEWMGIGGGGGVPQDFWTVSN